MAEKVKVLEVTVPEAIGAGAPVLRALADAKINIVAFCGFTMGPEATLTFVVEPGKEAAAKTALKKPAGKVTAYDAVLVAAGNKPGAMAGLTEKLAAAKVNIKWAYATTAGKNAAIVFVVDSAAKAVKAFK
jgi:hypothetical protein